MVFHLIGSRRVFLLISFQVVKDPIFLVYCVSNED